MTFYTLTFDTADQVREAVTHALSALTDRVHPRVARYPHYMYKVFFLVSFRIWN